MGDDIDEADLDAELACLEDEFDEIGLDEGIGAAAVPAAAQDASLPAVPMGAVGPAAAEAAGGGVDEFGLPVTPAATT